MSKFKAILPIAQAVGPFFGPVGQAVSAIATVAGGMSNKQKSSPVIQPVTPAPAQAPAFRAAAPTAMARPASLSSFATFTPQQERSALATKSLNQGLGKDEEDYYENLVQRSLIGDDQRYKADVNSLLPVESQYFNKKGISTSNVTDFLRALQT